MIGDFEIDRPDPPLRNPHCIVMLRPWVNVGNVGAIVLGRLARLTFAREIGRLARPSRFYDYTRYRPEMKFVKNRRVVKVPNTTILAGRRPDEPDFLLLQMMEPHMNAEDFNDSVLKLIKELGVSRYVLVGGMYDSVPHTRPLRVTGSARGWTPPDDFSGVRIGGSNYQGPTSLTSQLTDRARREVGVETLSLIVHLPLYLKLDDDYAGAAQLLRVLSSQYGFGRGLPEIAMGDRQYGQVGSAMASNTQLQELVKRFEGEYDQESKTPAGQSGNEKVELPPEIEKFLEDVSRDPDTGESPGPQQGGV